VARLEKVDSLLLVLVLPVDLEDREDEAVEGVRGFFEPGVIVGVGDIFKLKF